MTDLLPFKRISGALAEHQPLASEAASAQAAEPEVELFDGWLRVRFPAGSPRWADFHYLWLRHQCEKDRHPLTRERTVDPCELPEDIRPVSARLSEDRDELLVRWDESGQRESRYPIAWLRTHAYAKERHAEAPPPADTAAITLHASDYPSEEALVAAVLPRLRATGAVIVRRYKIQSVITNSAADPADTETLITALSSTGLRLIATHFGRLEDLRVDNTTNQNTDQLGYTDAAIEAHTDQPFLERPPRYQLLHCIRPASVGGDNYVVDGLAAARYLEALDREAFARLTTTPVRFHRQQRAFERIVDAPLLTMRADGSFQIRYSYFTMAPQQLPFAEMAGFYRAYRRFARLVRDPRHQYRLRLSAGDFLIYDNHRMLHARTGFQGARWLRGVYFDEGP
jgi:alpha-ketoglutarate-dependent taurine dioxygenase